MLQKLVPFMLVAGFLYCVGSSAAQAESYEMEPEDFYREQKVQPVVNIRPANQSKPGRDEIVAAMEMAESEFVPSRREDQLSSASLISPFYDTSTENTLLDHDFIMHHGRTD